jgi:uncharacterized repeat protein (TIGR01451 family)
MFRSARRFKGLAVVLVAMVAFGVFAVSALADAPDATQTVNYSNLGFAPNQMSVTNVTYDPAGNGGLGTTTITVQGGWAWPTHGTDCNTDRAGAGYAIDWYDANDAGYAVGATGISVGSQNPHGFAANTDANVVQPTPSGNDPSNPASVTTVSSPASYASWRGGCGKVSTGTVTGWQGGGNPPTSFSQGFFGPISHTYMGSPSDLPSKVCALTYDVHPGTKAANNNGLGIPGGASEITAGGAGYNGDNSIEDNGKTPAGNMCAAIVIPQPPALQVAKTADAAQVNAGQQIGFTITVYNTGTGDATGVTLSDPLPTNAGLNWAIESQGAGWSSACAIAAGTLNCGPDTIPAGTAAATSTFTVHITSTTTSATGGTCPTTGVVNNTAMVDSTNAGTGQASASTCVNIGHFPPPTPCTAVSVQQKQFYVGRSTKVHMTVTQAHKAVKGVRVLIKGPRFHVTTGKSNAKGKITQTITPKKAGVITFKPIVKSGSACKVPRVGVTGVFTPPVTG